MHLTLTLTAPICRTALLSSAARIAVCSGRTDTSAVTKLPAIPLQPCAEGGEPLLSSYLILQTLTWLCILVMRSKMTWR